MNSVNDFLCFVNETFQGFGFSQQKCLWFVKYNFAPSIPFEALELFIELECFFSAFFVILLRFPLLQWLKYKPQSLHLGLWKYFMLVILILVFRFHLCLQQFHHNEIGSFRVRR